MVKIIYQTKANTMKGNKTMKFNKLLIALVLGLVSQVNAGTMIFSGVITAVDVYDGNYPGVYSDYVQPKVGDAFSGHVSWTADRSRIFASAFIEPDNLFDWSPGQYGYAYFPEDDVRSIEVYLIPYFLTFGGGTDGGFAIYDSVFFAGVADLLLWDEGELSPPHVYVSGPVLKQAVFVPDTGSTIALLGVGFGILLLFRRRAI